MTSIELFGTSNIAFSKKTLKTILETGNDQTANNVRLYLAKYFIPVINPTGFLFHSPDDVANVYNLKKKADIIDIIGSTSSYRIKIDDKTIEQNIKYLQVLMSSYFENVKLDTNILQPKKYVINDQIYINAFGGFPHIEAKPYSEFDDLTKYGVEFILRHIKNIWCSNIDDQYEYVINWLANVSHGKRNNTALYMGNTKQGIGKSIISEFLCKVYGISNSLISKNSRLITEDKNSILLGKVFVSFEDAFANEDSKKSISENLKSMITSDTLEIRQLYKDGFTVSNCLNIIIMSQYNLIKFDSSDRRFQFIDMSSELIDQFDYFERLADQTKNVEVQKAFFKYLRERNTSSFKPQKLIPTKAKKDTIANTCPVFFQYIKEMYLMRKRLIDIDADKLFNDYVDWYHANKHDVKYLTTKNVCGKMISDNSMGRKTIKSAKGNKFVHYEYTYSELLKSFIKNKWITEDEELLLSDDVVDESIEKSKDPTEFLKSLNIDNNDMTQFSDTESCSDITNTTNTIDSNITVCTKINDDFRKHCEEVTLMINNLHGW